MGMDKNMDNFYLNDFQRNKTLAACIDTAFEKKRKINKGNFEL
jgi:hypothetical protein